MPLFSNNNSNIFLIVVCIIRLFYDVAPRASFLKLLWGEGDVMCRLKKCVAYPGFNSTFETPSITLPKFYFILAFTIEILFSMLHFVSTTMGF